MRVLTSLSVLVLLLFLIAPKVWAGTAPVIDCNAPSTIVPPDAPISFTATATDNGSSTSCVITDPDCFTFTNKGKRIDKTESCVVEVDRATITIQKFGRRR